MALPDTDHVARTCKQSSLDPLTRRPTPASFEFRLDDESGWEVFLSVNWLELLADRADGLPNKLAKLREYQQQNPHGLRIIKPTVSNLYAVLPVASVRSGAIAVSEGMTVLDCEHEPEVDGDPHSGVHPMPGSHDWSDIPDDPVHLAVQLFLFESVCHTEPGVLPLRS